MENNRIRVAITQGDTNGVGYELIFKTFETPEMMELLTPVVYGSPKIAAYHRKALGMEAAFSIISNADELRPGRLNLLTCFDDEVKVELGKPTPESERAAQRAFDRALADHAAGGFDVLVTLPQGKDVWGGVPEYKSGGLCMMVENGLRIGFATERVSLKEAIASVNKDVVVKKATTLYQALRRDCSILNPRVAVLALNPGADGDEENSIIKPAVDELNEKGLHVFGPFKAEELFAEGGYDAFDGILAMYYEQGMVPFKTLTRGEGVMVYAGLPFVCTAVNGEGQPVAGKGQADPSSLRYAIYAAIDMFRNRTGYDLPMCNPLPKLNRERRDEGEKLRFSVPKKREAKDGPAEPAQQADEKAQL